LGIIKNLWRILERKSFGRIQLERPRKQDDNINRDLDDISCKDKNWPGSCLTTGVGGDEYTDYSTKYNFCGGDMQIRVSILQKMAVQLL
jgi:hypothetical protein